MDSIQFALLYTAIWFIVVFTSTHFVMRHHQAMAEFVTNRVPLSPLHQKFAEASKSTVEAATLIATGIIYSGYILLI
jgi:predicted secreted protein